MEAKLPLLVVSQVQLGTQMIQVIELCLRCDMSQVYQITDKDYLTRLKEQHDFLKSDIQPYLNRQVHFAYKLGSTLRTIFHNTYNSKAILPGLAERYNEKLIFKGLDPKFEINGLVLFYGFSIGKTIPDLEARFLRKQTFEEYWNSIVLVENEIHYTRKQIILFAANKMGGSHVDPEIPKKFIHLVAKHGPRLKSKRYDEETLIGRVTFEMAYQTKLIIDSLIPKLDFLID